MQSGEDERQPEEAEVAAAGEITISEGPEPRGTLC